jgi:hypothetical protein
VSTGGPDGPPKVCPLCRRPKPADRDHFGLDPRNRDGLSGRCRECRRVADRIYGRHARGHKAALARARRAARKGSARVTPEVHDGG